MVSGWAGAAPLRISMALLLPFAFMLAGCVQREHPSPDAVHKVRYSRIVSLSPSITEILFSLGLGDRVAGVTRFCLYPPEAQKKIQVGGYYDPNYEAIVRVRADLIIMLPEHTGPDKRYESLGAELLMVDHTTISGIIASIGQIGERCGAVTKARLIMDSLKQRMDAIEKKAAILPRPRVLVSLGRGMGSGSIDNLYIAGQGTMYDQLLRMAGGVNAWEGIGGQFPQISLEGLYALNPEVIIDMVPDVSTHKLTRDAIREAWNKADRVSAVAQGRVCLLDEDYVTIPGPRIALTLEAFARAIHPEVAWE
jgi:iron complex transport system substrate-binding protein